MAASFISSHCFGSAIWFSASPKLSSLLAEALRNSGRASPNNVADELLQQGNTEFLVANAFTLHIVDQDFGKDVRCGVAIEAHPELWPIDIAAPTSS
jgi:hypothetical protein